MSLLIYFYHWCLLGLLMKQIFGRIISWLVVVGSWLFIGARYALELIGYATLPEDARAATGLLKDGFLWLLSIPWWAPWSFALLSTALLIWVSWLRHPIPAATSGPNSQIYKVPTIDAVRAEPPREETWRKTPAYDVPKKLAAIDEALEIFGFDTELQKAVQRGAILHGELKKEISEGRIDQYFETLKEYREECWGILRKIDNIRRRNEKFKDIYEILSTGEILSKGHESTFMYSLGAFIDNMKRLGPNPTENHLQLFQPFADSFRKGITDLKLWQIEINKALLARRRDLTD